ncbi:MAG: hypothetical protein MJH10_11530 [Epibacterium sp.]|nr:hypothetical protein [Epibacterium sp.]NQX74178.1 hypothetical protein [Epibacterium sp.]
MKALLIRRTPVNYIVSIEGQKPFKLSVHSNKLDWHYEGDEMISNLCEMALESWDMHRVYQNNKLVIGQLPNGDYAATLINKNALFGNNS